MRDPLEQLRALTAALPADGAVTLSATFLGALVATLPSGADSPDLDLPSAAQALGISVDTARRLVKRGALRGFRAGSQWRVSPAALESFRRGESAAFTPVAAFRGHPRAPRLDAWRAIQRTK
jgi:excisionase family DNA binding protein